VAAYVNLADLYRALGKEGEAEAVLTQGLGKQPEAAALHYTLGLARVRQKKTDEAVRELAEAARLDPASARYAYVWAVALHDTGHPKDALRVLKSALQRHPYDRDLLLATARYTAQQDGRESAAAYAALLRKLDPENADYARLAAGIAGTP